MKKRILAALAVIFTLTASLQLTVLAYNTPVTDEVGYLTWDEIDTLNSYLEQVRNEYDMDVVVYIEQSAGSDNVLSRADDIYDYRGYGVGESRDGIMMYISMYPRKYTFSTCGEGIRVFNDAATECLTEVTGEYLRAGDYYNAVAAYAEEAYSMLTAAANGDVYGYGEEETADDYTKPVAWGLAVIIPLIVAALTTHARGRGMNTAQYNNSAANYVHGGMNLTTSNDLFLYSSIMRTPRMQNRPNAGGGGMSTTHMSSGGTTHGGGGGGSY